MKLQQHTSFAENEGIRSGVASSEEEKFSLSAKLQHLNMETGADRKYPPFVWSGTSKAVKQGVTNEVALADLRVSWSGGSAACAGKCVGTVTAYTVVTEGAYAQFDGGQTLADNRKRFRCGYAEMFGSSGTLEFPLEIEKSFTSKKGTHHDVKEAVSPWGTQYELEFTPATDENLRANETLTIQYENY